MTETTTEQTDVPTTNNAGTHVPDAFDSQDQLTSPTGNKYRVHSTYKARGGVMVKLHGTNLDHTMCLPKRRLQRCIGERGWAYEANENVTWGSSSGPAWVNND